MPHVLIVDDENTTCEALAAVVAETGCSVAVANDLRAAKRSRHEIQPDLILADLYLPDGDGMDLLTPSEDRLTSKVVVMTGNATVNSAVLALRLGASDYFVKPVDPKRLVAIVERLVRFGQQSRHVEKFPFQGEFDSPSIPILGKSPPVRRLHDDLRRVAPLEVTVLLTGESGTGKELAAHTIHQLSNRRAGPFIAVNCGAISPDLADSAIFGHLRNSFTGAVRQHDGFLARAHGGTLFLDEITEMHLDTQVKLLRVFESRRFTPVGAESDMQTDIRLVAATNLEPADAVAKGKLREDLYYRLSTVPLHIPPLRERGDDILLIADSFLREMNKANKRAKAFHPKLLESLKGHAWPGNVRELRNFLQRAYLLSDGNKIMPMPIALDTALAARATSMSASICIQPGTSLVKANEQLIVATLEACNGVKARAADILGITSKTLTSHLAKRRS